MTYFVEYKITNRETEHSMITQCYISRVNVEGTKINVEDVEPDNIETAIINDILDFEGEDKHKYDVELISYRIHSQRPVVIKNGYKELDNTESGADNGVLPKPESYEEADYFSL